MVMLPALDSTQLCAENRIFATSLSGKPRAEARLKQGQSTLER